MENLPDDYDLVGSLLIDEIFKALGTQPKGWLRRNFGWLFTRLTQPAAHICVTFDHDAHEYGFNVAANRLLRNFTRSIHIRGKQNIPSTGPVLILGNHPGTCDSMLIISSAGRDDIKFITGLLPPVKMLANIRDHFITTSTIIEERAVTILQAYRHLKHGHVVVIFPSGKIDPDPTVWPAASIEHLKRWSASLEIFIRKVPKLKVILAVSSGLLSLKFAFHPITWLRRDGVARRRLSEFLQVFSQVLLPGSLYLEPCLSYSHPMNLEALTKDSKQTILQQLIHHASRLLIDHMHHFYSGAQSLRQIKVNQYHLKNAI